jgi:predicted ribosome quality control (RQC) complex YloA/Tae2 family protein
VSRVFDANAAHAEWDAAGEALRAMSDGLAGELRRTALAKALGAQAKRLAKRAAAVEGDLGRLDDVERLQRIGRLLLVQGERIARGSKRAVLDDWETGGTIELTLDPATPAKSQAAGYFQKARRIQRGSAVMWERLEVTTRALDAVRALLAEVDGEGDVVGATLKAWTDRAQALGVARGQMVVSRGRAKAAPRRPYIEYLGSGGAKIWVGRGAADNDRLTTKIARPHDLWMHARGYAGAHVVVALGKGAECPPELLLDAATLAVHHSDARGADFAEVTWSERRYVRKPKGSAPGKVAVDRERVLALGASPERLRRLLAARTEE